MLHRVLAVVIVALTVGCGGATELNGDGSVSDGSGGTGPTTAGGTAVATTTTVGATNASSTTGGTCFGGNCLAPVCPDGRLVVEPGQCCEVCSCANVTCGPLDCPSGEVATPPGFCCPQCVEPACSNVVCDGPTECADGWTFSRPDGACCAGCIPDEPVPCPEIACPQGNPCPKGYVRGDYVGGCCSECLPDPAFCEFHEECVMADRPRTCCGCAEAISKRALDDDACWTPVADPRPIPQECYPDFTCDALCECPAPGVAICVENRCIEVFPQ